MQFATVWQIYLLNTTWFAVVYFTNPHGKCKIVICGYAVSLGKFRVVYAVIMQTHLIKCNISCYVMPIHLPTSVLACAKQFALVRRTCSPALCGIVRFELANLLGNCKVICVGYANLHGAL